MKAENQLSTIEYFYKRFIRSVEVSLDRLFNELDKKSRDDYYIANSIYSTVEEISSTEFSAAYSMIESSLNSGGEKNVYSSTYPYLVIADESNNRFEDELKLLTVLSFTLYEYYDIPSVSNEVYSLTVEHTYESEYTYDYTSKESSYTVLTLIETKVHYNL